jgi:hypothetical protein
VITLFLALSLAQGADKRLPIPDPAAQAAAEKKIRAWYKDDYAGLPAGREALGRKLLPRGVQHKDPEFRYVMLRDARELATLAGDAETALRAIDELAAIFKLDPIAEKLTTLVRMETIARSPREQRAALDRQLQLVDEAVYLGRLEAAPPLLARLEKSGKLLRDEEFSTGLRSQIKRTERAQQIAALIEASRKSGLKDWASVWMYADFNPWDIGRGTYNGRSGARTSHPPAPDRPYRWIRAVQLTRESHFLYVEVSALDKETPADTQVCDWVLVVLANGAELLRKVIVGSRWQILEVDLSPFGGQTVLLEVLNAAGGSVEWHAERAYWNNLCILPAPAAEAYPQEFAERGRRLAVPDAAQIASAEKEVKELQKSAGLKTFVSSTERLTQARWCLEQGSKTDRVPERYVLLRDAKDLAAQAGELDTAFKAVEQAAGFYAIDLFEEKLGLLVKAKGTNAESFLKVGSDAFSAGKGEAAIRALSKVRAGKDAGLSARQKELLRGALDLQHRQWTSQWAWQDAAPDQFRQGDFNKRTGVWQTHPSAPDRPFKWRRKVKLLAGTPASLRFEVSATQNDHGVNDFVLIVTANGKELHTQTIRGAEWQSVRIDLSAFAGQSVELELWNKSNDWHGEQAIWDFVYVTYEP